MNRSVEVQIGGSSHTVEEPRLRRAKLIARQVQELFKQVPDLEMEIETWSRKWERETAYKLDRTTAKRLFGPQLQYEAKLDADGNVLLDDEGKPIVEPKRDENGDYVYGPDHLKHLTNEDWEGSGNVLPQSNEPSEGSVLIHMFEMVYDKAEEPLMELLALMLVTNGELREARRAGDTALRTLIDSKKDLLEDEGDLGDMIALAAETYKMLKSQVDRQKDKLGELRGLLPGAKSQEEETEKTSGTNGKQESSTPSSVDTEAGTPGTTTPSSSESRPTPLATSSA
jgi:hypothetical protein